MKKFRMKPGTGSHREGSVTYVSPKTASDPECIVESELNLASLLPDKFEAYDGKKDATPARDPHKENAGKHTNKEEEEEDVEEEEEEEEEEVEEEEESLSDMTTKELKAHAKEHEIDLGKAKKKADILAAIEAAEEAAEEGGEEEEEEEEEDGDDGEEGWDEDEDE